MQLVVTHNLLPGYRLLLSSINERISYADLKAVIEQRTGSEAQFLTLQRRLEDGALVDLCETAPLTELCEPVVLHATDRNPNSLLKELAADAKPAEPYKLSRKQYMEHPRSSYSQIAALRGRSAPGALDSATAATVDAFCKKQFGFETAAALLAAKPLVRINDTNMKGQVRFVGYPSDYIMRTFQLPAKICLGLELTKPIGFYDGTDLDAQCSFSCADSQSGAMVEAELCSLIDEQ